MIAICDHNASENVAAVRTAAAKLGLAVIGGMEITSREEVHVLGLFPEDDALAAAQEVVYRHLAGCNDPETFGDQWVMTAQDELVTSNHRLLIGATDLTLADVVWTIHEFCGIAIAAHVDRPSFSVVSQLGFIPSGLGLDGVEVSAWSAPSPPTDLSVICCSDAHRPEEIGTRCTRFLMETATVSEVGSALRQIGDRRILKRP